MNPDFHYGFSEFPGELTLETPKFGKHKDDVLRRPLGYSPERIAELHAAGISAVMS